MKPVFEEIERFPQWALSYFVNCDDSGLSDEDKAIADAWQNANPNLRVVDAVDGTENEFDPFPAFGLACETQTVVVEVVA